MAVVGTVPAVKPLGIVFHLKPVLIGGGVTPKACRWVEVLHLKPVDGWRCNTKSLLMCGSVTPVDG